MTLLCSICSPTAVVKSKTLPGSLFARCTPPQTAQAVSTHDDYQSVQPLAGNRIASSPFERVLAASSRVISLGEGKFYGHTQDTLPQICTARKLEQMVG